MKMKVESSEIANSACWSRKLPGRCIGLDTGNAAMGTEWTALPLQRPLEMRPAEKASEVVCSLQQRLWLHHCHLTYEQSQRLM